MKITTFIVAAVATIASGMGSAWASDDAWHLDHTLMTSNVVTTQAVANTRIAMASDKGDPDMTYGNG